MIRFIRRLYRELKFVLGIGINSPADVARFFAEDRQSGA